VRQTCRGRLRRLRSLDLFGLPLLVLWGFILRTLLRLPWEAFVREEASPEPARPAFISDAQQGQLTDCADAGLYPNDADRRSAR
jgi:hypothetical protein